MCDERCGCTVRLLILHRLSYNYCVMYMYMKRSAKLKGGREGGRGEGEGDGGREGGERGREGIVITLSSPW